MLLMSTNTGIVFLSQVFSKSSSIHKSMQIKYLLLFLQDELIEIILGPWQCPESTNQKRTREPDQEFFSLSGPIPCPALFNSKK